MDTKCGDGDRYGKSVPAPNENGGNANGQDADRVVVDRQSIDHIIIGKFTEQNLSACKHCHCADDERKNRCVLVEVYFHGPAFF